MRFAVQVSLSGHGNVGSLEVVLPTNLLRQPVVQETSISHNYPYKFTKAALTGVPALKAELSTQVAIDANGLLKVCRERSASSRDPISLAMRRPGAVAADKTQLCTMPMHVAAEQGCCAVAKHLGWLLTASLRWCR